MNNIQLLNDDCFFYVLSFLPWKFVGEVLSAVSKTFNQKFATSGEGRIIRNLQKLSFRWCEYLKRVCHSAVQQQHLELMVWVYKTIQLAKKFKVTTNSFPKSVAAFGMIIAEPAFVIGDAVDYACCSMLFGNRVCQKSIRFISLVGNLSEARVIDILNRSSLFHGFVCGS